jgi:hemerythrin superfamily protein
MTTAAPADDLVSVITQDHNAVRQRLSEFDSASPDSREELFWKLTDQLVRHEVAEQVVVYPALRQLPGGDKVADARIAEEEEAEKLLASMEHLDPAGEEFKGAVEKLSEAVIDHVLKEETEVLPLFLAHEESGRLQYLAQKFKGAKLGAPSHPHPHLPSSPTAHKVLGPIAAFFERTRGAARESTNLTTASSDSPIVETRGQGATQINSRWRGRRAGPRQTWASTSRWPPPDRTRSAGGWRCEPGADIAGAPLRTELRREQ